MKLSFGLKYLPRVSLAPSVFIPTTQYPRFRVSHFTADGHLASQSILALSPSGSHN